MTQKTERTKLKEGARAPRGPRVPAPRHPTTGPVRMSKRKAYRQVETDSFVVWDGDAMTGRLRRFRWCAPPDWALLPGYFLRPKYPKLHRWISSPGQPDGPEFQWTYRSPYEGTYEPRARANYLFLKPDGTFFPEGSSIPLSELESLDNE